MLSQEAVSRYFVLARLVKLSGSLDSMESD